MDSVILDLGCGNEKASAAFGIDNDPNSDADLIHDITKTPWPGIKDNTFDIVLCNNIVEHVQPLTKVLEELYRVCKPGAVIRIHTPHCSSCTAWGDMTHVRAFNTKAWIKITSGYYSSKFKFKVNDIRMIKTLPRGRKFTVKSRRWFYILETYFIYLLGGFDGLRVELGVVK